MSTSLGMGCISSVLSQQEKSLLYLLFLAWRVHPACHELSTVECLIQPPRSFKRRLLSTLTTTAPLLQLAVNFRVCSDIFSFDSRDFLLSCKMQSCKRAKAKYTLLGWHTAKQTRAASTWVFSSAEQVELFWRRWGLVQLLRQLSLFWHLNNLWTSFCTNLVFIPIEKTVRPILQHCTLHSALTAESIVDEGFHPVGNDFGFRKML